MGDLHVDAVTAGFRRHQDVEMAAMSAAERAVKEKVDLVVVNGDVCDPDSGGGTLRGVALSLRIARYLNDEKVRNFWIAGNHDVLEDGTGRTTLTPLKEAGFGWTAVFETPGTIMANDWALCSKESEQVIFVALPFVARSNEYDPHHFVKEVAERKAKNFPGSFLVAGHLQVAGAELGSETHDMPRGREVRFPTEAVKFLPRRFCLNGHYHKSQTVGEVFMPGSLERLSFGEEKNQPGYAIVEV